MPQATATRTTMSAVGWVHVHDGRLLGIRCPGRNRFSLPGGTPEPGETDEQALVREVRADLGVELTDVRPVFVVDAPAFGLAVERPLPMRCFSATPVGEPRPVSDLVELTWLRIPVDVRAAPAVHAVLARVNR